MHKLGCFLLGTCGLYALEESPWLNDVYAFSSKTLVSYDQYRTVQGALVQPEQMNRDYVTMFSMMMTPTETIECEGELELARTPRQTYGFRSFAAAARLSFLDDIAGDIVSLVAGINLRSVTGRAVRDISSPYAAYFNGELTCSLGKEFSTKEGDWTTRGYCLGTLGLGNQGSLWDRLNVVFEGKFFKHHIIQVFSLGYFGYGSGQKIHIDDFHGWGAVSHSSIDMGLQYRYHFSLWGDLGVSYAYRIYARLYPEHVQTCVFSYILPFSFF
ncbi:MAG: hypothetical protein FJZ58_00075 [Chlamydiae bacterium]|nr:hypothetical protein [Chlamydiota bacterium]